MDWIQFPFEVDTVFHDGPNPPVVRQRWMFTDLPFLPVGTNTVFLNRIWDSADIRLYDVGMLPLGQNDYQQDARYTLPPNFHPTHICHREWLSTGEPWPNDLPPTLYDDFWIPFCCGPINRLLHGGYQFGGAVTHVYGRLHSTAGGYQFGGSVAHQPSYTHSTAGGYELGGEVVRTVVVSRVIEGGYVLGGEVVHPPYYTHSTAGGYVLGGEVVHSVVVPHLVAGGLVLGGEVVHSVVVPHLVAGGLVLGGEVMHYSGTSHLVAGGLVLGGAVVHSFNPGHSTAGGLVLGGTVARAVVYTDPTAGGFEIGGSAGDVYTPGPPEPGTSCTGAPYLDPEHLYSFTAAAFSFYWVKWSVVAGTVYYLSMPDLPSTATVLIYNGGGCPFPTTISFTTPSLNCRQFTATTTGDFWVSYSVFTGPAVFKFRLSTVGCL